MTTPGHPPESYTRRVVLWDANGDPVYPTPHPTENGVSMTRTTEATRPLSSDELRAINRRAKNKGHAAVRYHFERVTGRKGHYRTDADARLRLVRAVIMTQADTYALAREHKDRANRRDA